MEGRRAMKRLGTLGPDNPGSNAGLLSPKPYKLGKVHCLFEAVIVSVGL